MKVDFTRPMSLVSGRFEETREKEALRLDETKTVLTENQKKFEIPVHEVVNPEVLLNNLAVRLKFEIDQATGERVIQIVDRETGEVVRQIPPQELLHVMKTLRDLKGLLFATIS
jgi:flagellar protein FlaG